jgi:methylated-DNA-[protein]-cysteine S-methyltransferase
MNSTLESRLSAYPDVGTPPAWPSADVAYAVDDTPIGRILLARNDSGALIASAFVRDGAAEDAWLDRLSRKVSPRVLRLPAALDVARREFAEYFGGRRHTIDVPTDLVLASAFQAKVLRTLGERVGYGARSTYGELAAWIDQPRSSRAVGAALRTNPLCVVVPCHRVVGSSGALTGYAGGLAAKSFLLDLEARSA